MIRSNRAPIIAIAAMISAATAAMTLPIALGGALTFTGSLARVPIPASTTTFAGAQSGCPFIFPDGHVAVAPNQPEVPDRSTVGIINALCDVTLDFIGCGFTPTSITLGCDTNGDGVSDLSIPLKNIRVINRFLVQATIPSLTSTPGTAFPLACCGGVTNITLTRTVGAGDDNVFGPFTQTLTCSIDLGVRAPVVVSATPVEGDCTLGQNLLIPGTCFLLADGKPNVTSVFAVEVGNPNNVIQAGAIHILTPNVIDAFFQIGAANAGKTFLIFASGPNGTSRNLTALPAGAPAGCPTGNEQGVPVTFKCRSSSPGPVGTPPPPAPLRAVFSCSLDRDSAGAFSLILTGLFQEGGSVFVNGVAPRKMKLKDFDSATNTFSRMILKGRLCDNLPGVIVYRRPDGLTAIPLQCSEGCAN